MTSDVSFGRTSRALTFSLICSGCRVSLRQSSRPFSRLSIPWSLRAIHKISGSPLTCDETYDTSRDILVLQRPSQRKIGHRAAQALGNLGELLDLLDLLLASCRVERLDITRHGTGVGVVPRTIGDAVIVLAGEHAGVERRPDGPVAG